MKRLVASLLVAASTASASAQFVIDRFTIDGGGGTSTNATYSLSGTIGQPDAGVAMAGGNYVLQGGFWAQAIQVPGAPLLSILRNGASVIISWPATPGFVLQHTTTLSPINWQDAPSGSVNPAAIPATGPARFYRLRKQ